VRWSRAQFARLLEEQLGFDILGKRFQRMPVSVASVPDGGGLLFICSGSITAKDLLDAKARLLKTPIRLQECEFAIVDLGLASSLQLSPNEVREIADRDRELAVFTRPGLPVAVLAPTEVAFGLARMWEVFVENTGWETIVFKDRAEGEAWVRQKSTALSGG
jgi:hypothetical protein